MNFVAAWANSLFARTERIRCFGKSPLGASVNFKRWKWSKYIRLVRINLCAPNGQNWWPILMKFFALTKHALERISTNLGESKSTEAIAFLQPPLKLTILANCAMKLQIPSLWRSRGCMFKLRKPSPMYKLAPTRYQLFFLNTKRNLGRFGEMACKSGHSTRQSGLPPSYCMKFKWGMMTYSSFAMLYMNNVC